MEKIKIVISIIVIIIIVISGLTYIYTSKNQEDDSNEFYDGEIKRLSVNNTSDSTTFKINMRI